MSIHLPTLLRSTIILTVAGLALTSAAIGQAPKSETAPEPPAAGSGIKEKLEAINEKVGIKLQGNNVTEADLADAFKDMDALLAGHKAEKTDEVAQILALKAITYAQGLNDYPKAVEVAQQIKRDYPDTKVGKQADRMIAYFEKAGASAKIRQSLVVGAAFPDFQETDLDGKPLSLVNYKGKVVLVDFWATWCGPCVHELPNVSKVYDQHHKDGFEVVGISLDSDKDKLTAFVKKEKMAWPQFFDGKGWENKLGSAYGVNSIPSAYLLGRDGKIVGAGLRGEALETAVTAALAAR